MADANTPDDPRAPQSRRELIEERDLLGSALAQSERITAGIIAAVPAGVVHVAATGAIKTANAEALQILGLGYDELTKRYTVDFEPETIFEDGSPCSLEDYPVTKAIVTGQPQPAVTIGVRRPDGELSWCIFRAVPVIGDGGATVGAVVTITDITERKQAEQERTELLLRLHDAQRLEAVGRLAGGVAHDFNNLLTVILGTVELYERKSGPLAEELDEIRQAAVQAASLTRQLLAIGRRQALTPRVFSLGDMAREMTSVLQRLLGETIELQVRCDDDACHVRADPTELERVIVNLVANARDAMPGGGRAELAVRDRIVREDDPAGMPLGRYTELSVADTGGGIDEEVRQHIFEPFFTTRDGEGTGLGLATVHGVVAQSGGRVLVESTPGEGTTFRVLLPASLQKPESIAPPAPLSSGKGRGERVLVVEDEDAVRRVVSGLLRAHGFEVVAMGSSTDAVALSSEEIQTFDLLLTDVVMPGHTGPEVAAMLRARVPSLPVLFMSGHLHDQLGELPEDADLLAKPFTAPTLVERVRAALDRHED
jgi:two-component system, cell cycle sensor histidine kinase and response regulator CckA